MSQGIDERIEALVLRLQSGRSDCPSLEEIRERLISMIPRARQLESRVEVRLNKIAALPRCAVCGWAPCACIVG